MYEETELFTLRESCNVPQIHKLILNSAVISSEVYGIPRVALKVSPPPPKQGNFSAFP